jgi:pyrimidine-specific ribonucleoside hydrolase
MQKSKLYVLFFLLVFGQAVAQKEIIVITDCYHPYQDPGDNLDLLHTYGLKDIKPLGIILDISEPFRKDTADHATLWKDPRGPREAGFLPLLQLEYIYGKSIPYAMGPLEMMRSETDKMENLRGVEEKGIALFLDLLRKAKAPVEVLSFGSARVLAVAYNREPALLKKKIKRVHLSAGTASKDHVLGTDAGANMIPGGEWNVALDVHAFNRILKADLPLAIYPCAGKDGGFVKDINNTYFTLQNLDFLKEMRAPLQNYLDYSFTMGLQHDFLRVLDGHGVYDRGKALPFQRFHVWESSIWLIVRELEMVRLTSGAYSLKAKNKITRDDQVVENALRPIRLTEVRADGRIQFEYTDKSKVHIFFRADLAESDKALNALVPEIFKSL